MVEIFLELHPSSSFRLTKLHAPPHNRSREPTLPYLHTLPYLTYGTLSPIRSLVFPVLPYSFSFRPNLLMFLSPGPLMSSIRISPSHDYTYHT